MRTLAVCLLALLCADAFAADDLTGLWKAKKRFGPDGGGPLIVRRADNAYVADMAGRLLPVREERGELVFGLPEGRFRGKLEANGEILGHWFREGTPANGRLASTVVLRPDGAHRWRGVVDAPQDAYTFYLLIQRRPDGTLSAMLRNPERDYGTQQHIDHITRDGNAVKVMGNFGGRTEIGSGTYDPEQQTLTIAFNRGGVYELTRDSDDSDFYPRGKHPAAYAYRPPLALDDGWPAGTLEEANVDRPAIERLVQRILDAPMDSAEAPQVHALLIARHGKLVLEEYFHGEHRDNLHTTRSAGKSVTSILVGAAMHAGVPLKLSSRVYDVMGMPADDPQKRAMTLEHLLTMSSGFFCDDTNDAAPGNEETMNDQTAEPDWYRYTLKVPMATPPGENSVYCSASPHLALGMVGAAAGESPLYLFDRLVARPMTMRRVVWGLDPVDHPYGGGSVFLLPRDFLKIGQLMLDGGAWHGRQIVSREYARRATSPLYHLRNIQYGYLWWGEDYPYKNRMLHTFSARGAGGQTVTVVPELDLVIGTLAGNFSSSKAMKAASTDLVPRSIMPAVREAGDDKHAPVVERDYISPYGPSKDGSRIH